MTLTTTVDAGARSRTEYPSYGDQSARAQWTERLSQVTTLHGAVQLLFGWRGALIGNSVEEADYLWIEARIEDRVEALQFAELSGECIETTTVTGESIASVCEDVLAEARATSDLATLELIVAGFRRRYRPPVMPTASFVRTEDELTELLGRRRNKGQ